LIIVENQRNEVVVIHNISYFVVIMLSKTNKKIFTSYTAVLTKNRKEWEIEHQLVIENKCCENKNKNKSLNLNWYCICIAGRLLHTIEFIVGPAGPLRV
jgi:hypothetical protein